MDLALSELLDETQYPSLQIITGEDLVQNRVVRWATLLDQELPMGKHPDELVFITRGVINPSNISEFVSSIALSGAAALALDASMSTLPGAREAAQRASLPLFALSDDRPVSQVGWNILKRIMLAHEPDHMEHQHWLQRLIQGDRLPDLLLALSESWQRSILILDEDGTSLAYAGPQGPQMEAACTQWSMYLSKPGVPALIPEARIFAVPLTIAADKNNSMLLMSYQGALPTYTEWQMVADARVAIHLAVQHHQTLTHQYEHQRTSLLWDLVKGEMPDDVTTIARCYACGFNVRSPMAVVVGHVDSASRRDPELEVIRVANQVANDRHMALMSAVVPGQIVLLLGLLVPEHGTSFMGQVVTHLRNVDPSIVVSWGMSEIRSGIPALVTSYQEAYATSTIGRHIHGSGQLTLFEQIGGYQLLYKMSQDAESHRFWERHLGGLLQAKSPDLLTTLETYLAAHGNASEAARQLGLHRQTMNYRLQRIAELTGCDLEDPQERFSLDLSVRLYRLHMMTAPHLVERSKSPKILSYSKANSR
jgi:sugar diacid utilization regulator